MKNTVKKGFLAKKLCFLAVLALFVVGGVFAQRVGDTGQFDGRTYRMEEVRSDGRILLQPAVTAGLDGVWRGQTSGTIITISGNTGVYTSIGNNAQMQDALSKGRMAVGELAFRNIRASGNAGQLAGETRAFAFSNNAPNVNTSVGWRGDVITQSADGRSFTFSNRNHTDIIDHTYTRQ